ncbi:Uncharacterised protein [uncultured archaeon]|nr:Uncharacterised protein [uncultured archaeon]
MEHDWKVYAFDRKCYVFQDGEFFEVFEAGKKEGHGIRNYFRLKHPVSVEEKQGVVALLPSMKLIASSRNEFLYVRDLGMHFDGLARKLDEAGEIAKVETLSEEEANRLRDVATHCLQQATELASLGSGFYSQARGAALNGLICNPDNKELEELLISIESLQRS